MQGRTSEKPADSCVDRRTKTRDGVTVAIPGRRRPLRIDTVVIDFNGTLAVDGRLIRGVAPRLKKLAKFTAIVVMTADTFGSVRRVLTGLPVEVCIIRQGADKRRFVESVGPQHVAAIGNGVNDVPMLKAAALGIAVIGDEGASGELLRAAMVVVRDINLALDLLLKPKRLTATLRR
jgi:P-type E1-E2 ATPase